MKNRRILCLLFYMVSVLPLFAQESITHREILSLDKGWKFHLGDILFPVVKGHDNTYNNAKAGRVGGAASPNFDDSSWRILNLPHDWAVEGAFDPQANLSQGYRNRGYGWYRRKFRLSPDDKGKHLELQFDGISTHATIWVNGTVLHRNWCGYTSMYIDITPYATYGDNINTIAVRVDSEAQEGWWYEGAGIYRHTWLVKRSPLHITTDGVYANPVKKCGNKWEIPVEVQLYNSGKYDANASVKSVLYDPQGKVITEGKSNCLIPDLCTGLVNYTLYVDEPELWSTDKPVLYTVKTTVIQNEVVTDQNVTKCGFRTIRFDKDTGFWLNGKNIKIKGVCNHQDHAGVGVAVPDALWEFRLKMLKDMGVNAYRSAHNPSAKEFMDACDSLGIMVLDENRLFNTSPEYVSQLEWLVRRDRNRPSVILWSVFNEEPMQGSENGYEMVRRMSEVVKKMDTTRPVTAAMNGGLFSRYNVSQAVDVVGFNYQIGSYDRFHKENPDVPLTSSEDGSAFMVRGEYRTDKGRHVLDSYDTHCAPWGASHRQAWKAVAERPWLAGCFYWTGFDYRGEPTPFQWPSAGSFFGIMDLCGFPKMAYYMHQAQWREDIPVLHLVPHWNWSADTIGKPIKVMALSNADSVKLVLNGKTISGQKVDKYEMNTWTIPYKAGKLEVIGYDEKGKVVSQYKIETTGKPVRLKLTPYRDKISGDGQDAVPVRVEALDAKGRHVPTANLDVIFSVTGPAEIIGLGNGNPNSHESEKGNKRSLFNGLAQVILQSKEAPGEIVLTASAEGLVPASVSVSSIESDSKPYVPEEYAPIILSNWVLSPATNTRPDVIQKIADNDMNSWMPVAVGELQKLNDKKFAIFRTTFTPYFSHRKEGGHIVLKKVNGKAEIWLNGELIGKKTIEEEKDMKVVFPPIQSSCELRILVETGSDKPVGFKGHVTVENR